MFDLLNNATTADVRHRAARVAVLPIGSFEQHGEHLPLTTDTVIACSLAARLAQTYPMLLLPPVTVSCSHEHAAFAGTVSVSARTLQQIVEDVAVSLHRSGVDRLVLLDGHGGNHVLGSVVQEYTSVHGPAMTLFPAAAEGAGARAGAGLCTAADVDVHGGELETSLMLHLAPELVRDGAPVADVIADDAAFLLTLGMAAYSESGVLGRPSQATAAKGEKAVALLLGAFPEHLVALDLLVKHL